jgi:exosortase/archaeosortase family protein
MGFLDSLDKHKSIILKVIIFVIITYGIVPFIFYMLTLKQPIDWKYNFFSFPAYTLIMVVLFFIFNRKFLSKYTYAPKLQSRIIYFVFAVVSYLAYYFIRFHSHYNYDNFPFLYLLSGLFYIIGILFVGFGIFGLPLFKKHTTSLLIFALFTYFFYIATRFLWKFALFLAKIAAIIVYWILSLFSETAFLKLGYNPTLGLADFRVIIGPPCSGIESLTMFIALFLLFIVFESEEIRPKRAAIVLIIGLVGSYALNVLRLALIMIIGTKNPDFALGMFHSNIGWILFSVFILIILFASYKWMKKPKKRVVSKVED